MSRIRRWLNALLGRGSGSPAAAPLQPARGQLEATAAVPESLLAQTETAPAPQEAGLNGNLPAESSVAETERSASRPLVMLPEAMLTAHERDESSNPEPEHAASRPAVMLPEAMLTPHERDESSNPEPEHAALEMASGTPGTESEMTADEPRNGELNVPPATDPARASSEAAGEVPAAASLEPEQDAGEAAAPEPDGGGDATPTSSPELKTMPATARKILAHQFSKLKHTEEGVREPGDVEAVHDMRVALRRMNSAIRLFKQDLPKKQVKKLRPVMKDLRDALGVVRNLDVLSADLEEYRAQAPDPDDARLQALADRWHAERKSKHADLVGMLDGDDYAEWCKRMDAFSGADEAESGRRVTDVLPALLWKQYGAVRAYESRLEHASLDELHALRIAIKRLRYTLEFFRDPLSAHEGGEQETEQLIKPLVTLQDVLGWIHDAVVASRALADFIIADAEQAKQQGDPIPEFQALAAYHSHLLARIDELRAQLPEQWAVITAPEYRSTFARASAAL